MHVNWLKMTENATQHQKKHNTMHDCSYLLQRYLDVIGDIKGARSNKYPLHEGDRMGKATAYWQYA